MLHKFCQNKMQNPDILEEVATKKEELSKSVAKFREEAARQRETIKEFEMRVEMERLENGLGWQYQDTVKNIASVLSPYQKWSA